MCALMLGAEGGHVSLDDDRLRAGGRSVRGLRGWFWSGHFWRWSYAAATMLWVNHGPCLKALGATTHEFYSEVAIEIRRFLRALAAARPVKGVNERPAEMRDDLRGMKPQLQPANRS